MYIVGEGKHARRSPRRLRVRNTWQADISRGKYLGGFFLGLGKGGEEADISRGKYLREGDPPPSGFHVTVFVWADIFIRPETGLTTREYATIAASPSVRLGPRGASEISDGYDCIKRIITLI